VVESIHKAQERDSFLKVQFSLITCTGIPKAGKTSFSNLLLKKRERHPPDDYTGDHCTIFIKKRNLKSKRASKWKEIDMDTIIEEIDKYVKPRENSHAGEAKNVSPEEIWSLLILLDISIPTPALNLLPPAKVTFIACRLSDPPFEKTELSSFLNSSISKNCFITEYLHDDAFKELLDVNHNVNERYYTAFVGLYDTDDEPIALGSSLNNQLKLLQENVCPVQGEIPSPYWFLEGEKLLYPVKINSSKDTNIEKLQNQMDKAVSACAIYNIPITWMMLLFLIKRLFARNIKQTHVRYSDILESVWNKDCRNYDESELKAALQFFHYVGALLYFKDVSGMCKYILSDYRWIFKNVAYLLYSLKHSGFDFHAYNTFKYDGLLNAQLITESEDYFEGGIPFRDFLGLLEHLKFLKLLHRFKSQKEYFIPYALPSVSSEKEALSKQFGSLQREPLVMTFLCGSIHRSFFYFLVANFLNKLPKNWSQPCSSRSNAKYTFCDSATFPFGFCSVSFIDRIHYLEIQIRKSSEDNSHVNEHYAVYQTVCTALPEICAQLNLNPKDINFGFLCTRCSYPIKGKQHIMVVSENMLQAKCCKVSVLQWLSKEDHLLWFNEVRILYEDLLYMHM